MDRQSFPIVTIFGASGFVGTQLTQVLARRGYRIRAAVRRPDLAHHLRPLGDVGQVVPIQANLRYPASVASAVEGAGIVINLVGIGFERGAQGFNAVNVEGARTVAEAAKAAGAETMIHMSILGAHPDSPSAFARSRAAGEVAVADAFPEAYIIRPSIIFGNGDSFATRMAFMARMTPALPLIGGKTKFQPVYVGDVAEAVARSVDGVIERGRIYELGGPEVLTFRQCLETMLRIVDRKNPLVSLPFAVASLIGSLASLIPFVKPPLTADQVTLLRADNIVSDAARAEGRTLEAIGIEPALVEVILPSYLWRFRPHGQFDRQAA
jgi:NADH dehydrogenase